MIKGKSLIICIHVLILVFSFSGSASALEEEIGNIVIQRTMSQVGHEFYREFTDIWTPPPGGETFNICIQEKADARWGSLITIHVDDRMVYRNIVGLRTRGFKETAEKAVNTVKSYIMNALLIDQQDDNDMAKDGY